MFGFLPEFGYAYRAKLDGRHLTLEHVPLIHILISSNQLYCPGPDVSRRCSPEPLPLCLDGEVARAGVWHEQPLCFVHTVVGLVRQRDYILTVFAQGPRRQIVVVADVSDNSLVGARGRILQQLGPWSICR